MAIAARAAHLEDVFRDVAGVLVEREIHLVDSVAGPLVVHHGPRAKFGDGQESRPREKLVSALAAAAGRNEGRERKAREVVTGEKAFAGEVAVAVEVAFDRAL